jgi:signal transduction histidine kinase
VSKDYLAAGPARGPLPGRQWLAAVVLIACAQLATLALAVGPYPQRGQPLFLALLACAPILLLRRWPLSVLAAATAANVLVMALGNASLAFAIMLGLAMYLVASRLPRRVSIRAAAATAAALGGALAYASLAIRGTAPAVEAVEGFLPAAAAWFVGDSVAARRRYLAGLAEQAERERAAAAEQAERERAAAAERARQQVQQERVRIARELHDVVAHTLAVMTVQAGVGRRLAAKRPEEASKALESIETIGRMAHEELRVVLGLLREEEAGAAVLAPAPRLADLCELVENVRASGTPVDLRMSGTDQRLSPALELSIYRVVQEALTNVVKHAPGACASVDLTVSAKDVRIEVADDGGPPAGSPASPGQDGRPAIRGTGHGIVGMRERIGAFGGWLVAEPRAGDGFRVLAEVPVEGAV